MEQARDIRLAPIGPEHAATTLEWVRDPEVARNLGLRQEPSMERTVAWISKMAEGSTGRAWAIVADGAHVGNVVLDQLDGWLQTARLSIYLGAGRGLRVGRRAVALAAQQGFTSLGLHKIWLTVHAENEAALRAYRAVGFVEEGRLRDEFLLDGRRCDAVRMGLLPGDLKGLS